VANEYLVRERDRRRLRDLAKVTLVLAPVALALTAFTWVHLQVLDAGYRIDRLEHELHALERQESRLRLEASYLSNPKRIERRAREELGMRPPAVDQLVFVEEAR
jgi:cell division protein FtsL